jgi:DnaJ-class molecular chaperone
MSYTEVGVETTKKCIWCRGTGSIKLRHRGLIPCLNCKGSGKGFDGGTGCVSGSPKPWMNGNKFQSSKKAIK